MTLAVEQEVEPYFDLSAFYSYFLQNICNQYKSDFVINKKFRIFPTLILFFMDSRGWIKNTPDDTGYVQDTLRTSIGIILDDQIRDCS